MACPSVKSQPFQTLQPAFLFPFLNVQWPDEGLSAHLKPDVVVARRQTVQADFEQGVPSGQTVPFLQTHTPLPVEEEEGKFGGLGEVAGKLSGSRVAVGQAEAELADLGRCAYLVWHIFFNS